MITLYYQQKQILRESKEGKLFSLLATVLPTQPKNRQTADFGGLSADKNFGKIGCRFLAPKLPLFADF